MPVFAFPHIDPVAFSLGPLRVHWYGVMYLLGFGLGWALALYRVKRYKLHWNSEQIGDLIFYAAIGVIIGGRLGYMLFYSFDTFIHKPWIFFRVWEGGMSFHGGLIGVTIALWLFSRKIKKPFLEVGDFVAPLVPLGIAFGRLGNFINGELWGRVTNAYYGVVFPHVDDLPRHPSQLYELTLEGMGLFILVWVYARKPRHKGAVSGVFLMGYAVARFGLEFFREPDPQLGFIAFNWLTMGQLLSLPMLLLGFCLWWKKL